MKPKIYLFLVQYIIFCVPYDFINASPLVGENIRQVRQGEFPYVVSLIRVNLMSTFSTRADDHFCTGTLITKRDVLTSSHCLDDEVFSSVKVLVGSVDLDLSEKFHIFWWLTYDQWMYGANTPLSQLVNDIANIRLIQDVPSQLRAARLSSLSVENFSQANVVMAGWGLSNQGTTPNIMESSTVNVLTPIECERQIERLTGERCTMDGKILCTAAQPFVLLECGDSGGPLLFMNKIIGINQGVCPSRNPANFRSQINLHISIDAYRDFINTMKAN